MKPFKFPQLVFWDKTAPGITFINKEDFWKNELLANLGLDENDSLVHSMGSSSYDEVTARQQIMRLLHENPDLSKFVGTSITTGIPQEGQAFLDEFRPDKPNSSFVEATISFIQLLGMIDVQKPLTGKIAELFNFLKSSISELGQIERNFGKLMGEEIEKASNLHGTITVELESLRDGDGKVFRIEPTHENEAGLGYRHFSYSLHAKKKMHLKKDSDYWEDINNWRIFFIVWSIIFFPIGIYFLIHNYRLKKRAFNPMIVDNVPYSVTEDICIGLKVLLLNKKGSPLMLWDPKNYHRSGSGDRTFMEVYYSYGKTGLLIRILKVFSSPEKDRRSYYNVPEYPTLFKGYSASYIRKIKIKSKELSKTALSQAYAYETTYRVLNFIHENVPSLLKEGQQLPSPGTDSRYKYYSINEAIKMPHIARYYNIIKDYRSFMGKIWDELGSMAELLQKVVSCSNRWNIPVQFPEILACNEHVIGFETIYPIHLIGRKDPSGVEVKASDLIPINSLPPLNGQIIGLTGQNGGGKTATINEFVYMVFLAQSGLPVFGEGVRLNVKKIIGLVFNTRGSGSQLQNFLAKCKNVLQDISNESSNEVVVLLDELGSGAQNEDGIELGKQILAALNKSGASIIYNTQLPQVAQYSQDQLGAACFKYTLDHQVTPGIGKGGAFALADEVGITQYLKV